jgi:hypothetical protein
MRLGGCQCGQVRFALAGEPEAVYVCHCRECRKQSASAFGVSLAVPRASLTRVQGETRTWTRGTDSGGRLDCVFCPTCGTRLWHAAEGGDRLTVKGGALDDPVDLARATHIWTRRKLDGVLVPEGCAQFPQEPPPAP